MEPFEYSAEFREMIAYLHRGGEGLPRYDDYLSAHLGGPGSRLLVFSKRVCPEIEYHCGTLRGKRVLDFGCGTGATTAALAEYCDDVSAFDIGRESIDICRRRLKEHGLGEKVKLYCGDSVDDFREAMGKFDVIVINGVLEHIPITIKGLRQNVLESTFSLLNESGYLFINGSPNRLHPYDTHTTQLWWVPWSRPGSKWAYSRALSRGRFGDMGTASKGPLGLEEAGAWGVTYWEIKRYLAKGKPVFLNTMPGHDRYIFYATAPKNRRPNPLKFLVYLIAVRLLRIPLTALRPFIENLVIVRE